MRTSCLRAAAFWVAAFTGVIGAREGATFGADRNACGCYQTDGGSCYCDKKSKCGCPGECEPKGCEEKRQKQMDKEIHAETKRAQDSVSHPRRQRPRGRDSREEHGRARQGVERRQTPHAGAAS